MRHTIILSLALLFLGACKQKENNATGTVNSASEKVDSGAESTTNSTKEGAESPVKAVVEDDSYLKEKAATYATFGAKIKPENALTKTAMLSKYQNMRKGDTLAVKFTSSIKAVCKKKGCWMEMDLGNNKVAFVRFKDYGFFVPLNADGSEAIVAGRAYIDLVSVEERRHYAKDEGKSEEEIAKITEPKITYAFQADGVLIKE